MTNATRSLPGLGVVALLAANAAHAQTTLPDSRWQAFVGCWKPATAVPAEAAGFSANTSAELPVLCVVPTTGSAVRLATVDAGNVMVADTVDASGVRRAVTREGCAGWERASFARNGRRVEYASEFDCAGVGRTTTGVLSVTADGVLLDVQGIAAGAARSVRVARYVNAGVPASLPPEVAAVVGGRGLISSAARTAAGTPLSEGDVIEAARALDPVVLSAWLIERGDRFAVDARALARLADAGVPGSVTDVLVALSNPRHFAIDRTPLGVDLAARQGTGGAGTGYTSPRTHADAFGSPFGYGRYWLHDQYAYHYGQPYGYGHDRYGYGSGQYFYRPPVIVVQPRDAAVGGRAVKGRGYTRSGSGESNPRAQPSSTETSGSGARRGSGGSSSSGGRKAKPRP